MEIKPYLKKMTYEEWCSARFHCFVDERNNLLKARQDGKCLSDYYTHYLAELELLSKHYSDEIQRLKGF